MPGGLNGVQNPQIFIGFSTPDYLGKKDVKFDQGLDVLNCSYGNRSENKENLGKTMKI